MADDIQSNIRINVDTTNAMDSIRLLQNQISAFHQQMSKMGAASVADSRNMQQNLINSINSTGQFAANITKIKTTAEQFSYSLEKNKLTMGEYFRYAGGATKTFGKLFAAEFETINKVARERVKDLQSQYIKLGRDANGAMQAIKVRPLSLDMENLGTKTQIAAQRQQLLNQLLRQGSTNLLNFGKNTQWAGRQLMVGFTVPLSIMGGAAMKAYREIEEASLRLKRVYGDFGTTAQETEKVVKQVQALALEYTKYGIAVKDSMEVAATAAATGKKGADLLAQISSANRLSALGGIDQQKALQTTISLTDAFSISAKDLGKNINFLNAVENQTVLSIDDLTTAIPKAAPVIQQLGGDVKDLAFFLTAMKEGGINASEGANAIKSGLASIINPTNTASKMLQGFGINLRGIVEANKGDVKKTVVDFAKALDTLDPINRAKAIEQLFGKFQFARMSTLFKNVIEQGSQASEVLKLANQSSLELSMLAQRELGKIEASPLYKFQKAIADFQAQMAPVGEQFMKAVTPIINFGTDVLKNFNSLGEGVKGFIVQFVAVAGVIGPVLLMSFGLIANAVANVIKGFALVKDIFNKTGKSSMSLGDQVSYMTNEQIQAAAIASSLDQVHSKLKQTFTSEAAAVDMLTAAYERSVTAQRGFAVPTTPRTARGPVKKYASGGMISGPGTGTSDSILAMVSNGEAIIPAKSVARNPGLVRQLISGNIPGFARGVSFDDPYNLSESIGLKRGEVFGKSGYNPLNAQIHAKDAVDAGHIAESAMRTAEEILANMISSMRELGATSKEVDAATRATTRHFETQAQFLRDGGMNEEDIANYRYQTYSENVIAQPSFLNNKGSGQFSPSEIQTMKGFYRPGAEGATAFSNLTPHLKALGLSEQEVNQTLIAMADNLNASLSTVEDTARFNLDDLSRLATEAQDQAVEGNQKAQIALEKIRSAEFTTRSLTSHARPSLSSMSYHYKGRAQERLDEAVMGLGLASSPYSPGGKPTMMAGVFEEANSPYSPRTMKIAMEQIRKTGAEGIATVDNMIRQYGQLGARFVPEMVATVESILGPELMAQIETTVARNVDTISTSMVNGVEEGFDIATERNSPPRKLIKAGEDSGNALVSGARSQIDDAANTGKAIAATISQNALVGTSIMSNGVLVPVGTQSGRVPGKNSKRVRQEEMAPHSITGDLVPLSMVNAPLVGAAEGTRAQKLGFHTAGPNGKVSNLLNNVGNKVSGGISGISQAKFQGGMFGASMIAGLGSMVGGPVGQISSAVSMPLAMAGMFPGLQKAVGLVAGNLIKFVPVIGTALAAWQLWDQVAVPLIKKNADAFNAISDTLNITKDKIDKINNFFGTELKLTGIRATEIVTGDQTLKQATVAKQFQQSQEFKDTYQESAQKMKSLSNAEFKSAMQAMAVDLVGQGADQELAKAIVDAIALEANKSSVSIAPELFSIENPETKNLMNKNIGNLMTSASKNIKNLQGQLGILGDTFSSEDIQRTATGEYDNLFGTKPVFADPETIAKLKAGVTQIGSYMSALSGQFENGAISAQELSIQYNKVIEMANKQPGTAGIDAIKAAFITLNAEIGNAIAKLDDMQFGIVSEAILAGVTPTQNSLDAMQYGSKAIKQAQTELFTAGLDDVRKNDKERRRLQSQISGIQKQTNNLANTEQKINDKYDKRIAQIEKIKRLNEQISNSQKGQLALAEALNSGDIAAAAEAAMEIERSNIQNALDNQQDSLNEAKKAEVAPLNAAQESNTTAIDGLTEKINKLNTDGIKVTVKDAPGSENIITPKDVIDQLNLPDWLKPAAGFIITKDLIDKIGSMLGIKTNAATGGHITGPGSGTSDSIPAMLSNGEYVIRANAVKTIGVNTLDKLNQADRLGFAAGGMIRAYKDGGAVMPNQFFEANPNLPKDKNGNELSVFDNKMNFRSAKSAEIYYTGLINSRRAGVSVIESTYQKNLKNRWMTAKESNTFRDSNLIDNRTYGIFDGLDQDEAKVFALALSKLYGKKGLETKWASLGLNEKLLLNKTIPLSLAERKYWKLVGKYVPQLSANTPKYANGGLVGYQDGGLVGSLFGDTQTWLNNLILSMFGSGGNPSAALNATSADAIKTGVKESKNFTRDYIFDPTNPVDYAMAAIPGGKIVQGIGKGFSTAKGAIKGKIATMNAKKVLGIMGGKKARKLTPQVQVKMTSLGLEKFIGEDVYKTVHQGVKSSAGDLPDIRNLVENAAGINKALRLKPGQSPAYGFLGTKEAVPYYGNSIYGNNSGQGAQQLFIDKFNKMINPYGRGQQLYGSTVLNLKPGALRDATVSFGDSLSIYQQAVKAGVKTPQVMRLGSLLTTLKLSSMARKTKGILGKDFEMPYAEIHMGSGFGLNSVSGVGVSNEFKDRVPEAIASVESMLAKAGKSGIPVHDIIGRGKGALNKIGQNIPKPGKYFMGGMVGKYADGGMVKAAGGGMMSNGQIIGGYSMGGMVPEYFADGGYAMGTDTVPAMLTPGEFVIKKSAVDRIGTSALDRINNGYADGGIVGASSGGPTGEGIFAAEPSNSVYNNTYEINVNVRSESNAEEIARTVLSRIKQVDNQRVRGINGR